MALSFFANPRLLCSKVFSGPILNRNRLVSTHLRCKPGRLPGLFSLKGFSSVACFLATRMEAAGGPLPTRYGWSFPPSLSFSIISASIGSVCLFPPSLVCECFRQHKFWPPSVFIFRDPRGASPLTYHRRGYTDLVLCRVPAPAACESFSPLFPFRGRVRFREQPLAGKDRLTWSAGPSTSSTTCSLVIRKVAILLLVFLLTVELSTTQVRASPLKVPPGCSRVIECHSRSLALLLYPSGFAEVRPRRAKVPT